MIDEKFPPQPLADNPLNLRLIGVVRTPSTWVKIARAAEKEKRFGDAYYYWNAGATAHTRSSEKRKLYEEYRDKCLKLWQENNKISEKSI